jgi:hypothetical protein
MSFMFKARMSVIEDDVRAKKKIQS